MPVTRALAELQELVPHVVIATQNVDGLHARAGSRNVLEIHGSIFDVKCTGSCVSRGTPIERLDGPLDLARLQHDGCGGMRRPGVVWFGESLPQKALLEAQRESRQADVILVAGTSAQVEPAASLAQKYRSQTMIVEINPEPALRHRTRSDPGRRHRDRLARDRGCATREALAPMTSARQRGLVIDLRPTRDFRWLDEQFGGALAPGLQMRATASARPGRPCSPSSRETGRASGHPSDWCKS